MQPYYVMRNSGQAVFVKEADFFVSQGGLKEKWGLHWRLIFAASIEDARKVGHEILPMYTPASSADAKRLFVVSE